MEKFGYVLTQDDEKIDFFYDVLFKDMISCVRNVTSQENLTHSKVKYFKILKNDELIKFLHKNDEANKYGYSYLHKISNSEPLTVTSFSNMFFKDMLECITAAKSCASFDIPESVNFSLKIGYFKILNSDEIIQELHKPPELL